MKASLRSFGRGGVKIRIVIVFFLCMLNDDSWYENHSSTIASKSVFSVTSPEAKALLNTFLQCQWDVDILKRRATGLAKYVRYNGTRFRHSGVLGAQGSTMGKKKLDKIVRTYDRTYVLTSTPACKPGLNFSFQAPARFGGKSHGHPDF